MADPGALPFADLLDVVCPVSIVLGSGTITVAQCLSLQKHSVLPLQQSAGEDLQVVVNGTLIAKGEVVIVEDSTALRLTEIATQVGHEVAP
jgi:flagellar motor switch protein FliN/FliY